jgi:hypothetical protein
MDEEQVERHFGEKYEFKKDVQPKKNKKQPWNSSPSKISKN